MYGNNIENSNDDKNEFWVLTKNLENPKKGIKIILTVLLIVLLGVLGVFGYKFYFNPKVLFAKGINNIVKDIKKLSLNTNYDNKKGFSTTGNIAFKYEISQNDSSDEIQAIITELINKTQIKYDLKVKENQMLLDIDPIINYDKKFNIRMIIDGNKQYILFKKIFDKYIELDKLDESFNFNETHTVANYIYLFEYVIKSFNKNLDNQYITKSKGKISIDNDNTKVTTLTLNINEKQMKEICNKVIDDIKNDKKANDIVTSFYKDFKDYNIEIKQEDENNKLVYEIYTKPFTNKVVGFLADEEHLSYDGEKTSLRLKYIKNTNPIIEIFDDNKKVLKAKFIKAENKWIMNIESDDFSSDISISYKNKEIEKNQKNEENVIIEISLKSKQEDLGELTVYIKQTSENNADIQIDTIDSVKYNDLNDEKKEEIQNNLINIFLNSTL